MAPRPRSIQSHQNNFDELVANSTPPPPPPHTNPLKALTNSSVNLNYDSFSSQVVIRRKQTESVEKSMLICTNLVFLSLFRCPGPSTQFHCHMEQLQLDPRHPRRCHSLTTISRRRAFLRRCPLVLFRRPVARCWTSLRHRSLPTTAAPLVRARRALWRPVAI